MHCIRCGSERTRKDGQTRLGDQRWRCNNCGRRFTARSTTAFSQHACTRIPLANSDWEAFSEKQVHFQVARSRSRMIDVVVAFV